MLSFVTHLDKYPTYLAALAEGVAMETERINMRMTVRSTWYVTVVRQN